MNTCVIIGMIVVRCVAVERLTPAQAADILRPNQHVVRELKCCPPMGGSLPRAPQPPPTLNVIIRKEFPNMPDIGRRLDGTPLWMPPTVYLRRKHR